MSYPPILIFSVPGIHVVPVTFSDTCNSTTCHIELNPVSSKTSGTYSCEVSGDAPEFKLGQESGIMTVLGKKNVFFLQFNQFF